MIFLIHVPRDNPRFEILTNLGGRDYIIQFDYNGRQDRWYIHLFDALRNPLITGKKLTTNWPIGSARRADPRMPPGRLMGISTVFDSEPPGFSDLGRRVLFGYLDPKL